MPKFLNRAPNLINRFFDILDLLVVRVLLLILLAVGVDKLAIEHGRIALDSSTLQPMATDLRPQLEGQFFKARDEYIAAIRVHSETLAAGLKTEADDVNTEYELATRDLDRKREAYRRATDNLKSLTSRKAE